jgi:hypothetical protein
LLAQNFPADIGEYRIGRGMSGLVLTTFGISVAQFIDIVRDARRDDDVAERIWPAATVPPQALSAGLRRVTVADVPPQLGPEFQRLYGADLPPDRLVFDVLDADDAQAFPQQKA